MSADDGRHVLNMFLTQPLQFAAQATGLPIRELLDRAGDDRAVERVLDMAEWSSYAQTRAVLETVAALLGGPQRLVGIADAFDGDIGSMADISESLHEGGSLHAMLGSMTQGQHVAVSFVEMTGERTGENEWLITTRNKPGFEPYPEFCVLRGEMLRIATMFFGITTARVVEETCQCRGDDRCRQRLSWEVFDAGEYERVLLKRRLELLEQRMARFEETVTGLVLAGDLDASLDHVVKAATRAFGAPGFLLAVAKQPGLTGRARAYGIDTDDVDRLAAEILAGRSCPELPVTVDVSSARRHYGTLAAYVPVGCKAMGDQSMLEAYARLAATALDSAMSLEEARREADRARALLELASSLADIEAIDDMAPRVVEAVAAVVDVDRVVFVVADGDRQTARFAAASGYAPEILGRVVGMEVPISLVLNDGVSADDPTYYDIVYSTEPTYEDEAATLLAAGAVAHVVVPLSHNGTIEGWIGVSVIDDADRLAPSPDLEAQLRGLAAQACTAIRNARLVGQIRHQAMHDALTGLPNRALILDRGEQLLARARRNHTPVAALFFDLDGFKAVNDTLGHGVGDRLLQAVATRLSATVRANDTLARLGGDEFVVLIDGTGMDPGPEAVADRILEVLRQPFTIDEVDEPLSVTASIGIAVAGHATTAGELLRDADIALYEAKAAGKNRAMVFAPEMQIAVHHRVSMEHDLRAAIERGELFLVYQPILDLRSREITGVEALLRWQHPTRGVVAPDDFVPLLEQTGLIVPAGRWVLEEACRQLAVWHRAGYALDMSVNVSARQLASADFIDDVSVALALSGTSPGSLILEITETTIMEDTYATIDRLRSLKALGVRLAVDDFGTGYSSLAYLRQFPVDALKIDRSFISAIAESAEAGALIHTLVHLGKALGLSTLAEGIEDADQFARLQLEDCDSGQGFLFARPLPAPELEEFLRESRPSTVVPS